MKTRWVAVWVALALVFAPSLASAASPWTEKTTYGEKTEGKLVFGVTNALLGWTDLFVEPNRYHNEGKNVWAGLGKGLVDGVLNEVGGAFHLVTFMIPVDFPLPENGVDTSGEKKGVETATV